MPPSARPVAVALAAAVLLTACTSGSTTPHVTASTPRPTVASTSAASSTSPPPSSGPASTVATTASGAPADPAQQALAAMDAAHRVGQLFMAGGVATGPDGDTTTAITKYFIGSVILTGRSRAGVAATAAVTAALRKSVSGSVGLFIATDQEGGEVQVLSGPGFLAMPSGVSQGQLSPSTLRTQAKAWGSALSNAGVDVDLGPVMDTVPHPGQNPPIGGYDRQYGSDPTTVASHGTAFAEGLGDAGVVATLKHFPGLGRVTENTDTSANVTDAVTTRNDPYLQPFATAIAAGAPFVMMSTAKYPKIDPDNDAAFSSTVIGGVLRGDLHFTGVVISDDLGGAVQVSSIPVAQRAVKFIDAGGDIVLTVDASQIPAMTSAVLARYTSDTQFKAKVDAAALVVLQAKAKAGVLR